jgi:uncharacterized protein (DUF58 family)
MSSRPPGSTGPGPIPEAVLRGLDLTVRRRLEGLVPGDQRTPAVGAGTELAQIRTYREGDDVRQIDWNATARTGEPQVRVHVAERSVTTWLVIDASPSMLFGTADRLKLDVAEGVATAIGRLATRRGNRLGVVAFGERGQRVLRPRQGRAGQAPLARLLSGDPPRAQRADASLAAALGTVASLATSRSLVVVVADFRGERDWVAPLKRLAARHGVLALEVRDPREEELPDVGQITLTDPETGRQLRVDTRSRVLRTRFAEAAAVERDEVARELRRANADHAVLSTDGEWFRSLARFLGGPRRAA